MPYEQTVWVDDDGSLTVGTPFSAAHMNNLEQGIYQNLLAHDAVSSSEAGTSTLSWTHIPVAKRTRGVLIFVIQNGTAADQVTAVKYGALTLTELPSSPLLHASGSEDGVIHAYFAGTSVQNGESSRTCKVEVSGADVKRAVCYTLTADEDLTAEVETLETAATKNLFIEKLLRSGTEAMVYAAAQSGQDAPANLTVISPGITDLAYDFGSQSGLAIHLPYPKLDEAVGQVGWKASTEEEAAMFAVFVRQIRDIGLVTALPGTRGIGDRCKFVADSTNGVVWDLIYDGKGELPWKKIGGPPLYIKPQQKLESSTAGFNSFTTAIKLTAPLAGDYDIEWGASAIYGNTNQNVVLGVSVNGSTPSYPLGVDTIWGNGYSTGGTGGPGPVGLWRKTGIAATNVIEVKWTSNTSTAQVFNPWLTIDPVRVG